MSDLGWEERARPGMRAESIIGRALMARAVAREAGCDPERAWQALNAEIVGFAHITAASVNAIMDAAVERIRLEQGAEGWAAATADRPAPLEEWDGLNPPDYVWPVEPGRRYRLTFPTGTTVVARCTATEGHFPGVAAFEDVGGFLMVGAVIEEVPDAG